MKEVLLSGEAVRDQPYAAYRDLVALEEHGLIETIDNSGKRKLILRALHFPIY